MTIDKLDPKGLEAAKTAYRLAEESPEMIKCTRCAGFGYVHGFGEDGYDPDWCPSCGGPGFELAAGEEDRPLREAITAYRRASTAGVPGETPRVTEAMVEAGRKAADEAWKAWTGGRSALDGMHFFVRAALEATASLSSPPVSQQAEAVAVKPIGYAIADYFEDRRAEYEQNGTVIYAAPAGMATTPVYLSSPPVSQQAEAVAEDDDPTCTDCGGTGTTYQTERRCACQPAPDAGKIDGPYYDVFAALDVERPAYASPAPDAVEPVAWVRMKTLDPSKPLKATTIKDIADGWMKAGHKVKPLVIRSALHTSPVSAPGVVERPANCRNRLRDEGKAYPKSGCAACKTGGLTGCPHERVEGK